MTKGSENKYAEASPPEVIELDTVKWPGPEGITFIDKTQMFKEDSSGLDYHDGALWRVDNGTGTIWQLTLNEAEFPTLQKVLKTAKSSNLKDKGVSAPPGCRRYHPRQERMVYIASERDNAAKGTNLNMICR